MVYQIFHILCNIKKKTFYNFDTIIQFYFSLIIFIDYFFVKIKFKKIFLYFF